MSRNDGCWMVCLFLQWIGEVADGFSVTCWNVPCSDFVFFKQKNVFDDRKVLLLEEFHGPITQLQMGDQVVDRAIVVQWIVDSWRWRQRVVGVWSLVAHKLDVVGRNNAEVGHNTLNEILFNPGDWKVAGNNSNNRLELRNGKVIEFLGSVHVERKLAIQGEKVDKIHGQRLRSLTEFLVQLGNIGSLQRKAKGKSE